MDKRIRKLTPSALERCPDRSMDHRHRVGAVMSIKPETGPNIQRLAKHIEDTTGRARIPDKPRDYEGEARWFVAYHLGADMHDAHTSKDWAHCVMDGMQPLSDEDVGEFCGYVENEADHGPGEPTQGELYAWFGIKGQGS